MKLTPKNAFKIYRILLHFFNWAPPSMYFVQSKNFNCCFQYKPTPQPRMATFEDDEKSKVRKYIIYSYIISRFSIGSHLCRQLHPLLSFSLLF